MQEAIDFHLEGLRLEGLPIPEPSSESADVEVAACGRPVALRVPSPSDAYYICSTPGAVPVQEHRSMAKTKTVTVRLDPALKKSVEEILDELGLTTSQAIVLFYKQVQLHHGLPFDVRIPNETTRAALEDAAARRDLGTFDSADALFADLGI